MTVLSLMKYLMFVFNGLVFVAGISLLCVGIWVIADPEGVRNVISSSYLSAGVFLIIFVGVALSFLGFLGCYGAIARNRKVLLLFFLLILLVFTVEIVAAILIHIHGQKIRDDFLLTQLQQNYQGDNSSDVFSRTWNTLMIMFACCGISGPDDFQECSSFREKQPDDLWPHACCTHASFKKRTQPLDLKHCKQRDPTFINSQGCFSTIARILKKYVSITEGCCFGVIAIEVKQSCVNKRREPHISLMGIHD
ncbi:tetraspanin-18-like [Anolis sagrei]|uniref:tetraspanin-18-like n=1 Tax=Anolis sagrei TaxID=38937 RepID=UPI00351F81D0